MNARNFPTRAQAATAVSPDSTTQLSESTEVSDRLVDRSRETALSVVNVDVEAQVFTLQLGPRVQWQATEKLALLVQPAITVNLLDADVRRQEEFRQANGDLIASWTDNKDDQAWLMGAGVEVGLQFALTERWRILLAGGYEWVDDHTVSAGPDRVRIDPSGYQAAASLGFAL